MTTEVHGEKSVSVSTIGETKGRGPVLDHARDRESLARRDDISGAELVGPASDHLNLVGVGAARDGGVAVFPRGTAAGQRDDTKSCEDSDPATRSSSARRRALP